LDHEGKTEADQKPAGAHTLAFDHCVTLEIGESEKIGEESRDM
jgi:hypothetical protein